MIFFLEILIRIPSISSIIRSTTPQICLVDAAADLNKNIIERVDFFYHFEGNLTRTNKRIPVKGKAGQLLRFPHIIIS